MYAGTAGLTDDGAGGVLLTEISITTSEFVGDFSDVQAWNPQT